MKFQRRLSEPHIVFLQKQPPRWSLTGELGRCLTSMPKEVWTSVLKLMTGSSEPMIHKQCDRRGQISYSIYDPSTQHTIAGLSETEVRVWLEERYYQ